ncbi:hypothetical protein QQY66_48715 [Streptomyces sp. DG2A-72]|uniref:hypothetical protein n=1 Tax=Streptomyces sp. DG2A-72 TaxID=3051386 RepID=UPI00265BA537|nr:hypothetical protein [Streptomyces sp. DG2A-72]MDO0939201.1 hypothetical protein [Streptomyces sp. DG2A-72]
MARRRKKEHLRVLADPFTVAAPSGARIQDRLRVTGRDAEVLELVGRHLGHHQRVDLAERVRIGKVPIKDNQRAGRKRVLTKVSSSRMVGAMTRGVIVIPEGARNVKCRVCAGCRAVVGSMEQLAVSELRDGGRVGWPGGDEVVGVVVLQPLMG